MAKFGNMREIMQAYAFSLLLMICSCYTVQRLSVIGSVEGLSTINANNMQVAVSNDVIGFHFPIGDKIVYYPKDDFLSQEILNDDYTGLHIKE